MLIGNIIEIVTFHFIARGTDSISPTSKLHIYVDLVKLVHAIAIHNRTQQSAINQKMAKSYLMRKIFSWNNMQLSGDHWTVNSVMEYSSPHLKTSWASTSIFQNVYDFNFEDMAGKYDRFVLTNIHPKTANPTTQIYRGKPQSISIWPLARYVKLRVRRECREHFPRHRWLAVLTCITARASVMHAGIAN